MQGGNQEEQNGKQGKNLPQRHHFDMMTPCKPYGKVFGLKNAAREYLCYVNATMQCFLNIFPVHQLEQLDLEQMPVWQSVVRLMATVRQPQFGFGESVHVGHTLASLMGVPGHQMDAHEFLMTLLQRMDEEVLKTCKKKKKTKKKKNDWAEVSKTGQAIKVTTVGGEDAPIGPLMHAFGVVVVERAKKNVKTLEPKFGFSTQLDAHWPHALAAATFNKLPPVLLIHLVPKIAKSGKIVDEAVSVKAVLSVDPLEVSSTTYRLRCVVFHQGDTFYSGHYVSRLRMGDAAWSGRDDENVQNRYKTPFEKVGSFSPYMLFYERCK